MTLKLLDEHQIMTVAGLRPAGGPQATTAGDANENLMLYFPCDLDSQKAHNPAHDKRKNVLLAVPNASDVRLFRVTPW